MSRKVRLLSAFSVVALLLASCGGGDSSGRTKNSALCYATQEDKDAAVKTAQDAFDAAMGGGAPGDSISDTTVLETEDSVVDTDDSVVDEAPSDTVLLESSPADGGGYRRPAVRAASNGDTTVPPAGDGGALTPEQQQAQMDLEAAESQPLCDNSESSSVISCEITLVLGGENTSTCPEVVINFTSTVSTDAFEWEAVVGELVVASGTWNAEAESTKVVAFTYTPAQAEGAESTSEVTCTATATIDSRVSDDCADGDVRLDWGGGWTLVNTAEDGTETVLAQGTWAVEALSAENPIIIPISYGGSGNGDEEKSNDGCTATFTSTGVSWNCPNGELVVTSFDDNFDDNSWQVQACLSEGFWNTADGQDFYFSIFLNAAGERFLDGMNTEFPLDTEIPFTVPEDTEGSCTEMDVEEINWDSLPFSGQSDVQTARYSFTVPEEFDGPVLAKFESTDGFDVDIDDESDFEWYSCEDDECPPYVGYSMWDLAPGEYFFEIEDNLEVVTWNSNVEIVADPIEFPTLPFSYTSDGSETTYQLTLTETETVTLTATAGQTCAAAEDDEEENGFVDPEIDIYGPYGVEEDDDNGGRGDGNCSASLIEIELEPGTYVVSVEDDDNEGGSITLGSSVELTEFKSITWDLVSTSASPDTTFEIVVPAGGAWFRANTVINETVTAVYDVTDPEDSEFLSEEGCSNPDGDIETDDNECPDSFLVLLDSNDDEVVTDDDGGEQYSESTSNGIRTEVWTNHYASQFSVYLEEGIYTLVVMNCCGPWQNETPSTDVYEVRFGFGSLVAAEIPKVEVVADKNPTIPASVEQVKLPDAQLSVDGSVSTAISADVNTMVCDTFCIDAMFANAGITDGTITISAGSDSITMRKGQKKALIPIGKNAEAITATVVSADGSQVVNLSSEIYQLSATEQSAFASGTASSPNDSGFNLFYLLLLIPILGAMLFVIRRKQTVSISQ